MSMTPMRHALCARLLISACGGLEEAARACRLSHQRLHQCTDANPARPAFMPADAIADLEAYCGQPIYSREMFECRPATSDGASLLRETCKTVEIITALLAKVSAAQEDHVITLEEQRGIDATIMQVAEQLRVLTVMNARARATS